MSLTHRALLCLGWIVKVSDNHGHSTMGNHRPCDIRALFREGAIERVTRVRVEGRIRNTYRPTKKGLKQFISEWERA